jgi:hypothetical protein
LSSLALWTMAFLQAGRHDTRGHRTYLVLADTVVAISPAYTLLFISSSSRSAALRRRNFLKPLARMWRVFLAEPLPMEGRAWLPLNFLRILLSIPWGVLQEAYIERMPLVRLGAYSDSHELVRREAVGVFLLLLNDLCLVQGLDCHLFIFNKESKSILPI